MEEGLHRPGAPGQELDVVHEQDVHRAKALAEPVEVAPAGGRDELPGEGLDRGVGHAQIEGVGLDVVTDGVEQVGLPESGRAVEEQRVVGLSGLLGYCERGGVGEPVARGDHEPVEGVAGIERGHPLTSWRRTGLPGRDRLFFAHELHGERRAQRLEGGLGDRSEIALLDPASRFGGRADHERSLIAGHEPHGREPGLEGDLGDTRAELLTNQAPGGFEFFGHSAGADLRGSGRRETMLERCREPPRPSGVARVYRAPEGLGGGVPNGAVALPQSAQKAVLDAPDTGAGHGPILGRGTKPA